MSLNFLASIILSAVLLSGCAIFSTEEAPPAAGYESQFAKPANTSQRIVLNSQEVAGHRVQITDEEGPFWIDLHHNRRVAAGIGGQQIVGDGTWRVNKSGQLCLKSSVWWKDGTCFEMLGGTHFADATRIHSLSGKNGPDTYYPFAVLGVIDERAGTS
ncbi:DUF995 domain-containing protein [Dongia soli]|uniref:DUF995 domain-containing protein n=1 Tax=Dongia soli TaxID=600628 RepID=A0ABU5EB86_9PROT|nr:DUF995 domain-containing protein [Dongia soli]MDY0883406.1 DUF995 domain-containing protein [Dongia soli]